MKVIFGRSAFHRERFDLLKSSRLSQMALEEKIEVFYTMVFLEETIRMVDSARDELKRQWPFLRSICNAGWFKPLLFGQPPKLNSVCDEELASDEELVFEQILKSQYKASHKDESRLLVPSSIRASAEEMLNQVVKGPGQLRDSMNGDRLGTKMNK